MILSEEQKAQIETLLEQGYIYSEISAIMNIPMVSMNATMRRIKEKKIEEMPPEDLYKYINTKRSVLDTIWTSMNS